MISSTADRLTRSTAARPAAAEGSCDVPMASKMIVCACLVLLVAGATAMEITEVVSAGRQRQGAVQSEGIAAPCGRACKLAELCLPHWACAAAGPSACAYGAVLAWARVMPISRWL